MSKITVDINHLEKEIEEKTAELERLKAFYAGVKSYGQSATNGAVHRVNGKKKPGRKAKSKQDPIYPATGISEWIETFLTSKGHSSTKELVVGWGTKVSKPYNQVYNSVSNALQRLKGLGKIDGVMNEGGRRFGSTWFIKK